MTVDDLFSFVDVAMKDDTANYHNTMLHDPKKNNATALVHPKKIMLLCIILSWPLVLKKLCAGHLSLNNYYEQNNDAIKCVNTDSLHHANKNNTTAHHAEETNLHKK